MGSQDKPSCCKTTPGDINTNSRINLTLTKKRENIKNWAHEIATSHLTKKKVKLISNDNFEFFLP